MAESYVYSPLSSVNSTRIIRITPAPNHTDPLEISLSEISLLSYEGLAEDTERPSYYALSYVWGQKKGTRPILCDGKQFLVTPNCELALRYCRRTGRSMPLWVDSICIDQSSNREKSQQVARMGKIYQWADMAVIWLGENDELTPIAFRYLRHLALLESSQNKANGFMKRMFYRLWARFASSKDDARRLGNPHKGYLRDMLCGAYFQRFWTLQEIAMSRSAMVVCGSEPLSWPTFASGSDQFLNGGSHQYSGFVGPNGADKIAGFFCHYISWLMLYEAVNGAQVSEVDEEQRNLRVRFLITSAHSHQVSNPKDRVFALYNMFRLVGIQLPEPNYDKSEAQIYREATQMLIVQTRTLSIFEFFPSKNPPQTPSWVHDFLAPDGREGYEQWTACQDSRVDVQLIPENFTSLSLSGLKFDIISRIAPPVTRQTSDLLSEDYPESKRIAAILGSFQHWCNEVKINDMHPRTGESSLSAFFHTLVTVPSNWGFSVEHLLSAYQVLFEGARGQSVNDSAELSDIDIGARLWSKICSSAEPTRVIQKFIQTFWQFFEGKRFFITADGYFGTGPGRLEEEDVIVLLAGATMPMALRTCGDNFRLVGPVYVHGIMNGEAWPGNLSDLLRPFALD